MPTHYSPFIYFWLAWMMVVLTNNYKFIFFILFLHHVWKNRKSKNLRLVRIFSLFWAGDVWKTICMHARVWTLFHVANQQSGRNQVVGCNHNHHRKLQSASMLFDGNFYFIQSSYSHLFLDYIRLSWPRCPWWYKWCDLNFHGGGQDPEVCWNRSHHHQEEEEEEMAKAGMLAFLLFGWQENG